MSASPEVKQAAEWTEQTVKDLAPNTYGFAGIDREAIANAHNAATAKLREEIKQLAVCLNCGVIQHDQIDRICTTCQRAELMSLANLPKILAHQQPSATDISHWEPTLRDIQHRANSTVVRKHAALALEGLSGVSTPSAPTPDLEKIARDCARTVMLRYAGGQRGSDIIEPILQALVQARAPLVAALEEIATDCDEVSRDDSISLGEKRAWSSISKRAKRAALTGTGEK